MSDESRPGPGDAGGRRAELEKILSQVGAGRWQTLGVQG